MIDYKKVLDNITQPVALVDGEGKILFTNKEFNVFFEENDPKKYNIKNFLERENSYEKKQIDELFLYCFQTSDASMHDTYSDFISTVSHELRTPLTSIRGFADTMLISFDKLDEVQIKKFLGIIKEQSNRLIKLIENLLSITRMNSGNETLVYKALSVKAQIEKIVLLLKTQYPQRVFNIEIQDDILPVLADENKFQQILINLLDNAAKYSSLDTPISVSAFMSGSSDSVNIIIKDLGVGISKENIKKIFDKFKRVESHLTRKTQGSGLGLYIVKSLVEKMNGRITAESEEGKGSTFTITMPAAIYAEQSNRKLREVR